jgi:hypothetical protein
MHFTVNPFISRLSVNHNRDKPDFYLRESLIYFNRFIRPKHTCLMKSRDFEFAKVLIPEALSLARHGLDFVVGPFQGTGSNRVIIIGQETAAIQGRSATAHQQGPGDHPGPVNHQT